jgi:hypothetical protein
MMARGHAGLAGDLLKAPRQAGLGAWAREGGGPPVSGSFGTGSADRGQRGGLGKEAA